MGDNKDIKVGAVKYDGGKPRWDLFPYDAAEEVVKVLNYGAVKYEDRNWERGLRWGQCFGATIRHLYSWWHCKLIGKDGTDPESGISHLGHAMCNILFMMAYEKRGLDSFDDRPVVKEDRDG